MVQPLLYREDPDSFYWFRSIYAPSLFVFPFDTNIAALLTLLAPFKNGPVCFAQVILVFITGITMLSSDQSTRQSKNNVNASISEYSSEIKPLSCLPAPPSPQSDTRDTAHTEHGVKALSPSVSQSVASIQAVASAVVRRMNTLASAKQRRTLGNAQDDKDDRHPSINRRLSRAIKPQASKQLSVRKSLSRYTGSLSAKENIPVDPSAKPRRRPLANITNSSREADCRPQGLWSLPETAVKVQPVSTYNHGATAPAGLRIELNGEPLVALEERYLEDDTQRFNDFSSPFVSTPLDSTTVKRRVTKIFGRPLSPSSPRTDLPGLGSVNTTPLREAIAAFSDIFSSGGSQRSGKINLEVGATPVVQTPHRSSPALSTPSLKIPRVSGSISRLKRRLTLSTGSPNQYDEGAVSHDEIFGWESEMRDLERCLGVDRQP
ncbi:hypothetical protein CPB83DRAFT_899879 [Crepidotus variabilis]|uniref:Uncharacterized protein n=1 Tax=Crepidotus variabilis TaxID=179855 RepID=A0A9P6E419_9AGAR|nr:hypothetical protein CPB83DRAFT_899879 [Crepidotus variabilis]